MHKPVPSLGIIPSFLIFGSAALLLWLLTRYVIPYLSAATGQETILLWFIVAGLGTFTPLLVLAAIILKSEGCTWSRETFVCRLRFKRITRRDIAWSAVGLVAVMVLSGGVLKGLEFCVGAFDHSPPFMAFEPLSSGRYWLLAVWAPYWVLNIMGEEILWRGVLLPRQEAAWGKCAWAVHACGWGLFHVAFGWQLLVTLVPLIFIQSYIVQKTGNSWTGVVLHGGINGPSFIAIALGLI
jgi:membrane protease YdiL (CAAX protease family)